MKTIQYRSLGIIIGVFFSWIVPSASFAACYVLVDAISYKLNIQELTAHVAYINRDVSCYSGDVVIPESIVYNGQTYTVTSIGSYAMANPDDCYSLKSVIIPNSVIQIGSRAFSDCWGLTTVTIGNGVKSIGGEAFYYCTSLTSITIPSSVTDLQTGDDGIFCGCTSLASIIVDPNNTTYDSRDNCNAIIEKSTNTLIAGCYNTVIPHSVSKIDRSAFYECTNLTSIEIPNSVTSIGDYAFRDCTGLTSVTIGNSVTDIGYGAFGGCTGLTSVTIPNSVTSIGSYAFNNTAWYNNQPDGLIYINDVLYKYKGEMPEGTSISIRNGTVCIVGSAFSGCTGLTSVTIPNSITTIGSSTFNGCTGLTSVTIPNSVTSIEENAFYRCIGLASVTIPSSVTSIGRSAFERCTGLTSVTIPGSVNSIGGSAFSGCTGLTSVTIPSSVTSISYYAFENCTGLTSVTIPNSVTSIEEKAFSRCTSLTSVAIPISVTSIGSYAFSDCTSLTSVTIPSSVASIGTGAFNNTAWYNNQPDGLIYINDVLYKYKGEMPNGTSITIRNGTVCILDYAFKGCAGLTSVTIPSSVTTIEYQAFYDCSGLTSVAIPSSVTSIGWYAFSGCTGLTSVTIPSSVTSISSYAFSGCTNLTSVTIPSSVTSIGYFAFYGCTGLISVTIPSSVTSIDDAFFGCTGLTSIFAESEMPISISNSVFYQVDKSACTLYVPKGCKSVYEDAVGWRDFEHIVEVEFDTDISTLDNAIYVEQTEGRIGGTKDISVKMKNDFDVRGFQFSMELPEGSTINSLTLNQDRMPAGITMNKVFSTENIDGNKINVVCVLNDGLKTFTGNDGAIATVNVSFAEDMEEGSYPIYLTDISISDASAEHQLELSDIKATLILEDYVLGDTNGDGKVLVGDVISILNYIVGFPSENFNAKAADVNGDGKVLVGDVIAVLNIIVNL